MDKIHAFIKLADIFLANGYKLFLVGGSVRDYVLYGEIDDLDIVSSARPEDIAKFLDIKINERFVKYGAAHIHFEGYRFDYTTLRKENDYSDSRHPDEIIFTDSLKEDVVRRDFTVNALYLSKDLQLIDYVNGLVDLNTHVLRMIGDPNKRLKEDPLRILRAIRFSLNHELVIEESLKEAMIRHSEDLKLISEGKIIEEIKKMNLPLEKIQKSFDDFHITYLLDMVKL